MAKMHERAIALILAAIFLITSVATGLAVVWQIRQDQKEDTAANVQEVAGSTDKASGTNQPTEEGKLQGTKLNGFTPVATVPKLQITDITVGTGDAAQAGATVTAHYTGALAKDGTIFQSSHDGGQPIEFPLDGVIKGWTNGVPGMKVGGKRRLVIPYAEAYGEEGRPDGGIPAKADLVFDIELTAVKNP